MIHATADIFEEHRSRLFRLAYGMLGRVAAAEDAVQEAFLRWQRQDTDQIRSPKAWLLKVVSRICLDEIKSAKHQREEYIGPYLPEPLVTSPGPNPEEEAELAESVSMAMLVVLESLTPVQRAVFLLREVFDYDYAAIGNMIKKSEANCRKIAQRARRIVHNERPKFESNKREHHKLVRTFLKAMENGDLKEMKNMLAEDAIFYSDGGGKVTAARKPLYGASKIVRFIGGIRKKADGVISVELKVVNGEPGLVFFVDGRLYNVWSFHVEEEKIQSIYVVLNPDKLSHL